MTAPIVELTDAEVTALKQLIPNKFREHPEDPMIEVPVEDTLRTGALLDRVQRIKADAVAAAEYRIERAEAAVIRGLELADQMEAAGLIQAPYLLRETLSPTTSSPSTNDAALLAAIKELVDALYPSTPDPGGAPDREAGESLDPRQGDQPPADSALPGQATDDGINYAAVARIINTSPDPGHALWMFVEQERQVAAAGGAS